MITAQEIREKTFEKSFNGYNMSQVDEFLDQLVADISAMAKENAALRSKMRVLVEKVEEYRQTEDSMRLALLSAQKMSVQIESEAQQKADNLVAEAKETAERITRRAADGIVNEHAKLEEAKKATDKFFDHMRTVCQKQLEFYDKLSRMQLVGSAPAEVAALEAAAATAVSTAKKPASASKPRQKKPKELEPEKSARGDEAPAPKTEAVPGPAASAKPASPRPVNAKPLPAPEPDDEPDELPVEEEPTRRINDTPARKRREYGEFRFSDDF